jgi:hypothetical protein
MTTIKSQSKDVHTTNSVGLRVYPNMASHCLVIIDPKVKVKVCLQRQQWYQVKLIIKNKDFKGWIPVNSTQNNDQSSNILLKNSKTRSTKSIITLGDKTPRKSILKDPNLIKESSPVRNVKYQL